MNIPLTICKIFGLNPRIWMIRNPMKIYEFQEIINGANLNCNHRVLDFGCGKGHWSIIMSKKCKHVTGIDINPKKIISSKKYLKSILATKKVEFICNDLISQQFPDSSFDRLMIFLDIIGLSTLIILLKLSSKFEIIIFFVKSVIVKI